jgi:Tfp pilus assembly protein PilF
VTAPAPYRSAIEGARPAIDRLQASPDAAALVAAWAAVEAALQTVASDRALSGQSLIRDLRQRNVLTLDQGHSLIEFLAARDRAAVPGYATTDSDVGVARDAFDQLTSAPLTTPVPIAAPPAGVPPGPVPGPVAGPPSAAPKILGLLVLLLAAGGIAYVVTNKKGAPASQSTSDLTDRGVAAYAAGHADSARTLFTEAVNHDSTDARAHIYLGRLAREAGDLTTARAELVTAVRLAPGDEVAQREMGAVLLAAGQYDLARRFYARAVALDSTDKAALGFYGCTLTRLGQKAEGGQFLAKAGQGPWNACAPR